MLASVLLVVVVAAQGGPPASARRDAPVAAARTADARTASRPARASADSLAALEQRVARRLAQYRRTDAAFTAARNAPRLRPVATPVTGTIAPVMIDTALLGALAAPLRAGERAVQPRLDAVALAAWRAETVFVLKEPTPSWRVRALPASVAARLPALARVERATESLWNQGSDWVPAAQQRLMADVILASLDPALARWLDGTRFPVADDGERLARLTRDQFALALSSHARDCLAGRDDSCLRLLGLEGGSLPARERWYRPHDYPSLARRMEPPSDLPRPLQEAWRDCVRRDDRAACDRYIQALPDNRFAAPVSSYAAALLLDVALADDSAAVARLRAPGTMAQRLTRAAGRPISELLAIWRQRVRSAPAASLLEQPGTRIAGAFGWSLLLLGLGASRRRA